MRAYRVCNRKYAKTAFTGAGARLVSGRWHHAGTPVVYTSGSRSLMILEALVHFDCDLAPTRLVVFEVDIPSAVRIQHVKTSALQKNWRRFCPYPKGLQDFGTRWAQTGQTVGLVVPSAVVPEESNIILNPAHNDMARIKIGPAKPFRIDHRLLNPSRG
jgi:RES domain-containing protein